MTPLGDRTAPVLSTELETMTFPDGAALRRWVRRRTRRHLRGVWALVGDVYSVLLTIVVVGTILAPYLRRMLVARPGSVGTGALGGFTAVGLDPGWAFLALIVLLAAVGVGSLGRLGPLFLRPHEAAWWLPMPGGRGSLLVSVARVEYLIAATVGAAAGVLPAVAAGGGWVAAVAWPALMSAGACLVLTELVKAQILDRDVSSWRGLQHAWRVWCCPSRAPCSAIRRSPSWPACWPSWLCWDGGGPGAAWDRCMMLRSWPSSRGPSARTSRCCRWTPGPWGGCSPRIPPGPQFLHRCGRRGSGADCPDLWGC